MTIALIIPTLNEADSIGPLLAEIPKGIVDRIIVADGGSRDATADVARAHGAEVFAAGKGFGRACLGASQYAEDADIVVFMDGDGADDPSQLGTLLAPLIAGEADFVIASRVARLREAGSMSPHQVFAGWLLGWGVKGLYGVRFTDMCTFRAVRRDVLLGLNLREMTYGWNIEMQMRVAQAGLRCREIPVPYRCRIGGESKVAGSLRGTVRAASRIIGTFLRVATQTPSPSHLHSSPVKG